MNWNLQKQADTYKFKNRNDKYKYSIAKKTLDCLISFCDEDGETTVGFDTISKRICSCIQTVYNHFEILNNLGILKTEKIGRNIVKIISFQSSNEGSIQSSNEGSIQSSNEGSNLLEAKIREEKTREESVDATQQVATLKQKKTKILNDEQNESFEYIWKNYELETLVKEVGRNAESKTDVKKIYTKLVIDNKINYKLVEDYIADLYSNAIDINFLLGLRKIFNDVETFKELQRGQDEHK